MRCAEGRHEDDRPPGRQRAGDGVDAGHLERLVPRQRRQDAREPPPEHRLAGSRRACEQDVVLSRRRELERAAPALLAAHLGEVGQERLLELVASGRSGERDVLLAPQVGDRLGQVVHRDDVDARQRRLGRRLGRADEAGQPCRRAPSGNGDRARDRPHATVERELADTAVLEQPLGRELVRAASSASAIGRSKPEPSLRNAAGARLTVIRLLPRPRQHRVDDAAVHAVLGLLAGAVGEPDDRERGQVGRDEVRLDLDPARLEADDGGGEGSREHTTDGTGQAAPLRAEGREGVPATAVGADSGRGGDENRLEVLAGPSPRAPVDVALVTVDETQACPAQDLGIEVAAVVDDDAHPAARG